MGKSYTLLYNLTNSSPCDLLRVYGLENLSPFDDDEPAYITGVWLCLAHSKIFNVAVVFELNVCIGCLNDGCILAIAARWNITSKLPNLNFSWCQSPCLCEEPLKSTFIYSQPFMWFDSNPVE